MTSVLAPMLDKLQLWRPLDAADQAAVLALPHTVRRLRANAYMVREGDEPTHSSLLLSGYAIRHKVAGHGGRQIFSIHMKGDLVDLHNAILRRADHHIQTLVDADITMIPVAAIRKIAAERPQIGQAMWHETLVDAAIFREWTLNLGRREGKARAAHLLCEFSVRLAGAGLGTETDFVLPMTQEQLADALALTSVHINRTLKTLADEGLIERTKRAIRILEFDRLARIGDFDARYLHLDREPRRDD